MVSVSIYFYSIYLERKYWVAHEKCFAFKTFFSVLALATLNIKINFFRLEFDNNGGSDDEQLKDELLRIFDRERLGLETYFKQKTENILAGYRRKQYEWEEKIRSERMEYEKTLAQDKIEVQIINKYALETTDYQ